MTKKYELVCIFDPQLGDAAFEPLVEKYEAQLKAVGAEIVNIDRWGLRKMAYTSAGLKQRQQGFYVLYQFTAESDSMGDGLLHELKMDEGVLRHLLDTVPTGDRPAERSSEDGSSPGERAPAAGVSTEGAADTAVETAPAGAPDAESSE